MNRRAGRSWLSRNVVALGLVSLFTDAATEMIVPLLPAFVTIVLGGGPLALGWIEGASDATASVLKLLSGRWADRSGRNRPFVVAGYTLASVVRPLVALATAPWHVLLVRLTDRVGKGLRNSPRDAMLAASVEPHERGRAFGFNRALDHTGAVLGPLMAVAFLSARPGDLRTLFWLAAIPGALAVVVLLSAVQEVAPQPGASPPHGAPASALPTRSLLRFLVPLGLFTLGNASDVFLLLKAGATRAPLMSLPLLWIVLHVVKSLTSLVGGRLADRWGHRRTIAVGWLVYVGCYVGFGFAGSQAAVWALFLVYGSYQGLSEAAEKALVARLSPARGRGTGFGWYYLTLGFLTLAASVLFGALWETLGSRVAFLTSAGLAAAALVSLLVLVPGRSREERLGL
jgi:MFS family permease